MELKQYVEILRRRWRLVVVPALLAGLVTAGVVLGAHPSYRSTTTLFYTPADTSAAAVPAGQRLQAYVTLLGSERVAAGVIKKLALPLPVSQVQASLTGSASSDSLLLDVVATSGSRATAQQIAAAAANELVALSGQLERRPTTAPAGTVAGTSGTTGTTGTAGTTTASTAPPLSIAQPATAAASTRAGALSRAVPLAVLLGLVAGVIAALVRESVSDRVTSSRQLRADQQLTILASIPLDPSRGSIGAMLHDKQGPWAEAFRRMRTRLFPITPLAEQLPRTMVVTGCLPGSGTTTVAGGLGITLARAGRRVVIVGADLRHPALASQLWIHGDLGLTDVLGDPALLDDALQEWGDGLLTVLPAGAEVGNPGELIGSTAMAKLLATLESRFDVVVLEAPPILPFADPVILAGTAGCGVILVVRYGRTGRPQVQEAVQLLEDSGIAINGAVLTMVPGRVAGRRPRSAARNWRPGRWIGRQARRPRPVRPPQEHQPLDSLQSLFDPR